MKHIITFKLIDSTEIHCIIVDNKGSDSFIVTKAATLCRHLVDKNILVGEKFNIDRHTSTTIKQWDTQSNQINRTGRMNPYTVNVMNNLGKLVTFQIEAAGVKSAYNKALKQVKGAVFNPDDEYIHMVIYDNSQIPKKLSATKLAEKIVSQRDLKQARVITLKAGDTLGRMKMHGIKGVESLEDIENLTSMMYSYFSGDYKKLSRDKVIEYLGALIYFVRSDNVEPDFIKATGNKDMISVMTAILKKAKPDWTEYKKWVQRPEQVKKRTEQANIFDAYSVDDFK